MSDEAKNEGLLNGASLPEVGPSEPLAPDADLEREAFQHMAGVIDDWAKMEQLMGTQPMVAAAKMLQVMSDVLQLAMGRGAVRAALLMTYEKTFDEAMSFIQRNEAKQQLDAISNARRIVEGKGGILVPGGTDAPEG